MKRTTGAPPARIIFGVLGWCAVGLGVAGIVLPGMPTTVFVLIASYCFSRSSPRFQRWLRENRWLGPRLRNYSVAGGMPPSAKRAALAAMWIAVLLSSLLLYVSSHTPMAVLTVALGMAGSIAIVFGVRTLRDPGQARR
jgi:uncharacterized membrane protein YbaN (DUF454 family)